MADKKLSDGTVITTTDSNTYIPLVKANDNKNYLILVSNLPGGGSGNYTFN